MAGAIRAIIVDDEPLARRGLGALVDVELEPEPLAETQLLDPEVEVQRVELLPQGDLLHRVLVEGVAQEFREPHDGLVGGAVFVVEHQRRNGVQRVEQEMRIELVAQHLELRLLRERRGAQRGLTLLLQRLVVLDAEVDAGPAQQ